MSGWWVETARAECEAARADARAWLGARVRDALAPRRAAAAGLADDATTLRDGLDAAERRVARALARLDDGPFTAGLTVHAAHDRHPGVQAVFARHGLPRCPDCAVGADETLAEAAFGEGLEVETLLVELNALLAGPR